MNSKKLDSELSVFPNPIQGNQLNLQISNFEKGRYQFIIIGVNGAFIYKQRVENNGGFNSLNIQLPATIAKGTYQLIFANGITVKSKIITVQ